MSKSFNGLYFLLLSLMLLDGIGQAEEHKTASKAAQEKRQEKREKAFTKMLSNVELIGTYTQNGAENESQKERYTIYRVAKIPGQDYLWRFDVRMQFGSVDLRLPLPLTVRWAQDTPMVILDDTKIPGLGTFSAKVVFDKTRYAGTWQHGSDGGHLFGDIIKQKIKQKPTDK